MRPEVDVPGVFKSDADFASATGSDHFSTGIQSNQDWSCVCRCMGLTGFFHDPSIPEEQGIEVLRRALGLGVTVSRDVLHTVVPHVAFL